VKRRQARTLRLVAFFIGALLASLVGGCERGCIWKALPKAGLSANPTAPGQAWFGQGEVDCPDGLRRCRGGVVQASMVARRPVACTGNPEGCACPWSIEATCPGACVADDLELVVPAERALAQLCEPLAASAPFARARPDVPPAPTPAETVGESCEGEAFVCLGSVVRECAPAPHPIATCLAGCATDEALGGAVALGLSAQQAVAVLCSR
jgi:hypothetical protein